MFDNTVEKYPIVSLFAAIDLTFNSCSIIRFLAKSTKGSFILCLTSQDTGVVRSKTIEWDNREGIKLRREWSQ